LASGKYFNLWILFTSYLRSCPNVLDWIESDQIERCIW
jgi:hypothetical protein